MQDMDVPPTLRRPCLWSTQGMLQAHKMLIAQAALIRTSLTPGLSLLEFRERARHRSSTAGAWRCPCVFYSPGGHHEGA